MSCSETDCVSSCSGVIAINSTMSFELQPQDDHHHQQGEDEGGGGESGGDGSGGSGGGGGVDEGGVHLVFSTSPQEGDGVGGCGVSHTAVPPIHSSTHTHRVRETCCFLPNNHVLSSFHSCRHLPVRLHTTITTINELGQPERRNPW